MAHKNIYITLVKSPMEESLVTVSANSLEECLTGIKERTGKCNIHVLGVHDANQFVSDLNLPNKTNLIFPKEEQPVSSLEAMAKMLKDNGYVVYKKK